MSLIAFMFCCYYMIGFYVTRDSNFIIALSIGILTISLMSIPRVTRKEFSGLRIKIGNKDEEDEDDDD